MDRNYELPSEDTAKQSDLYVFAERIKDFFYYLGVKFKTFVIPSTIKLFYKLSILRDINEEIPVEKKQDAEYAIKIVNACNHAKQAALLDMAVFTSSELQDCIINQKTLKETVIEFQVIKNKLFIENRSSKGNFLYEGALVEQICKHFEEMTPLLQKIYIDFFKDEAYQYHCNSFLDISFEDLFDEKWAEKVCERLASFNNSEILSSEYPKEIMNKFKFMYMLIKTQEIKYEAITKMKTKTA